MFCRRCGVKNEDGYRFCERCGKEAKDVTQKTSEKNRQQRKSPHKKPLVILIIILFLANIAIIGWVFIGNQTTRAFNDAMEEGKRYLLAENLEQAEAHFLRAIEIRPREVEPYLQLADIYMVWDEPEEAIAILEQGLEAVSEEDRLALEVVLDEILETVNREPTEDNHEVEIIDDETRFRIEWVLEPSVEADDINYVRLDPHGNSFGTSSVNETNMQYSSPIAILQIGGALGLIDNNGNRIGEMIYNDVYLLRDVYLLTLIDPLPHPNIAGEYIRFHAFIDGEFQNSMGVTDVQDRPRFYYHNGLRLYTVNAQDTPVTRIPTMPIPVVRTERIVDTVEQNVFFSGPYGIFDQSQMLTDFLYNQMGSYSEGLLAVEKDGRWGYINRMGEVIIPIEYDASWTNFTSWLMDVDRPFAYAASEGFIPLVRDGVWELRTIDNELVIEPGIFEAIRPVHQGRSWVKQDGLWGIIEIITEDEEEAEVGTAETDDRWRDLYIQYLRENPGIYYLMFVTDDGIPVLIEPAGSRIDPGSFIGFNDGELVITYTGMAEYDYIPGENLILVRSASGSGLITNDAGQEGHNWMYFYSVKKVQNGEMVNIKLLYRQEWHSGGHTTIGFYRVPEGMRPIDGESITEDEFNRLLNEVFDLSRAIAVEWDSFITAEEMIERISN